MYKLGQKKTKRQISANILEKIRGRVMVFYATFNNISVILRWSVLLVTETGVPEENHRSAISQWQILSHDVVSNNYSSIWKSKVGKPYLRNYLCILDKNLTLTVLGQKWQYKLKGIHLELWLVVLSETYVLLCIFFFFDLRLILT